MPPHMRPLSGQECDRSRASVRMRIAIDGEEQWSEAYPASGLWGDGSSSAMVPLRLAAGPHRVTVNLADGVEGEWPYQMDQTLVFEDGHRRVVAFDRVDGFTVF